MTTVLVTGANRGLGLEFARQYSQDGARVFACCRNPRAAKELNALAKDSSGKLTVHDLDVASGDSVAKLKKEIGSTPIDILINNAGVYGPNSQARRKWTSRAGKKRCKSTRSALCASPRPFSQTSKPAKRRK